MHRLRFLLAGCLLASAVLGNEFDGMESQELNTAEQTDEAPKINWAPVWNDLEHVGLGLHLRHHIDGHDGSESVENVELRTEQSVEETTTTMPTEPSLVMEENEEREAYEDCTAMNDRGLKNVILQSLQLLPLEKMQETFKAAAFDEEVQRFRKLIFSADFQSKANQLRGSRDFVIFHDYCCKKLNLDLKFYNEYLLYFFNIPEVTAELPLKQGEGMRGLLRDLRDLIPKESLSEKFENLRNTDPYLQNALITLKSKEFRVLLDNFREQAVLKEMQQMLIDVGVPLEDLVTLVKTALGWEDMPFGAEQMFFF